MFEKQDINSLVILSTIIILVLVLMMLFIYVYFITQKSKILIEQGKKTMDLEAELSNSKLEIKNQSLHFINQELNDDLAQKLSASKMLVGKLRRNAEHKDDEVWDDLEMMLKECIQDIRNLSKNTSGEDVLHYSLIDLLRSELLKIEKQKSVSINFHYNHHDIDMYRKHSLILFRIIQEEIINSIDHYKARKIEISIIDTEDKVNIFVIDDGTEKDAKRVVADTIFKRIKMINANLSMNFGPGKSNETTIIYHKNYKNETH